jgi:hypothetical protein
MGGDHSINKAVSRFTQAVKSYTGRYYDTLLSATTTTPVTVHTRYAEKHRISGAGVQRDDSRRTSIWLLLFVMPLIQISCRHWFTLKTARHCLSRALRQISMDITSRRPGRYIWTSGTATGAMGSWTIHHSQFGISTTQGHIAALLTTDELGAAHGR